MSPVSFQCVSERSRTTPMDDTLASLRRITLIGTGLLGTSIGLGLKSRGYAGRLVGLGRTRDAPARAVELGALDEATTDFSVLASTDLAIICVPLGAFASVFAQIAPWDHPELVLTDVGSTKMTVLAAARAELPVPARFVGSHPMAGKEQFGPDAAEGELFGGKPCILSVEADTDPAAVQLVSALWQTLGMRVLHLSAQEHDCQTAAISHLPHAASVLLMRAARRLGGLEIASTGFRDTTRLASSNPLMRENILLANRQPVLEALAAYREEIDQLMAWLEAGDRAALMNCLEETRQWREQWLRDRSMTDEAGGESTFSSSNQEPPAGGEGS